MAKKRKTCRNPVEIVRRRRMQIINSRGYIGLFFKVCITLVAAWFIFTEVFLITQCNGMGMYPAVEDGDLVLAYRLQEKYEQGDVVLYQHEGKTCIGRIVARQTDIVMMDTGGDLIVNGTTQGGEIMFPTYAKEGIEYPFRVEEGKIFVLGDYRTQAQDSRDFGSVSMDDVLGKVITIVRRRGI